MIRPFPTKDPNSNLRYYWDWREWLAVEGCGPIVGFEIVIADSDGVLVNTSVVQGEGQWAGVLQAWITGGTKGQTYFPRCRITAADGTVEDDSRALTIASH